MAWFDYLLQRAEDRPDISVYTGTRFADIIDTGHGRSFAVGYRGDDFMIGGNNTDILVGWGGRDYLSGGNGRDVLRGGNGADIMNGGAGSDFFFDHRGMDKIWTGEGHDVVSLRYAEAGAQQDKFATIMDLAEADTIRIRDLDGDARFVAVDTNGNGRDNAVMIKAGGDKLALVKGTTDTDWVEAQVVYGADMSVTETIWDVLL